MPFWQRTEGVRANNKRAVLVVYSKESPCLLRCTIALPKKSSLGPDAPTTAQSYEMLFCFSRRSEGVQGAFRSPPACIAAHQLRRRGILAEGLTRRLRRGSRACSPMGRSHFSFDGERKVCKRKPAARRLREKALDCPFFRRGSQRRAQFSRRVISCVRARSCARLFPPSKWAGLFPSTAYRRSAPPQLALDRLKWR